jgi:predicted esterase
MKTPKFLWLLPFLFLLGCVRSERGYDHIRYYQLQKDGVFLNYYYLPSSEEGGDKRLFVFFDGSSKQSVLGRKSTTKVSYGLPAYIRMSLRSSDDLVVMDQVSTQPWEDISTNNNVVALNTFKNKTELYSAALDEFLVQHPGYNSVYLIGYSEGGMVLPGVYSLLQERSRVSGIVLCSSGGMSYAETLKIQQLSTQNFTASYRDNLNQLDRVFRRIKLKPNAKDLYYFGWPYSKWSGYFSYRPISDLLKIKVPILVIHGSEDKNIPVESSRYIETSFMRNKKVNLRYIEIPDADHFFNGRFETVFKIILDWAEQ